MPALIALGAPHSELAAANGLNTLSRASGGSLASAVGGTILASSVVVVGGVALPSLTAYRLLFAICAVAAVLGAAIALLVPYPPGYSPSMNAQAAAPERRSSQLQGTGTTAPRSVLLTPPGSWAARRMILILEQIGEDGRARPREPGLLTGPEVPVTAVGVLGDPSRAPYLP